MSQVSDPSDTSALQAFLDAHHVAHLATAGEGGAHSAPVFYARVDGCAIVWISAPHVLHSRHLEADAAMGASIGPSAPPLGRIEGVQLRGRASSPDADQHRLRAAWLARFPDARPMVDAAVGHRFYVLRPTWARLLGTEAGRPHNREWVIG